MTPPEVALWTKLRGRHPDKPTFRRQHPFGPYIVDFFCSVAKRAIEVDGGGHSEDDQIAHDERRDVWLRSEGLTVYWVTGGAVMRDSDEVADGIIRLAQELSGRKTP